VTLSKSLRIHTNSLGEEMQLTTAVGTRKFSQVATKFQVGVASLAVVAAATLTPPIAHATPSIVPFAQDLGSSVDLLLLPIITSATPGVSSAAAAVSTAGPIQNFITTIVQGVASLVYGGLTFIANSIAALANFVAVLFKVGPYAT
jgi:hypothetical protein